MSAKASSETLAATTVPVKKVARKAAAKKAPTAAGAASPEPGTKASPERSSRGAAAKKPAQAPEAVVKKTKQKLVRDSFTMPQDDFALIDQLKDRALGFKRPAKKSELLRAGLQALAGLSDAKLKTALDALAPLKPGRPRNTSA